MRPRLFTDHSRVLCIILLNIVDSSSFVFKKAPSFHLSLSYPSRISFSEWLFSLASFYIFFIETNVFPTYPDEYDSYPYPCLPLDIILPTIIGFVLLVGYFMLMFCSFSSLYGLNRPSRFGLSYLLMFSAFIFADVLTFLFNDDVSPLLTNVDLLLVFGLFMIDELRWLGSSSSFVCEVTSFFTLNFDGLWRDRPA